MPLWIQVTMVNVTQESRFYEGEQEESAFEKPGDLFKALTQEYGKCVSKMFRTFKEGGDKQIGWVFQKREFYTDANRLPKAQQTFIQETWVEVFDRPDEVTRKRFNHKF